MKEYLFGTKGKSKNPVCEKITRRLSGRKKRPPLNLVVIFFSIINCCNKREKMNIFGMGVSDFILLVQTLVLTITLIVLIWQTRISVKSIKAEQYQNAVRMLFDWSVDILNDEKLVKDYETETYFKDVFEKHGVNKYFHTLKLFHTLEFFYLLYEDKMIDEDKWGGCKNNFRATLTSKKVRDIWRELNTSSAWNKDISIFHPAFQHVVDNIIQEIEQNQANGNEG